LRPAVRLESRCAHLACPQLRVYEIDDHAPQLCLIITCAGPLPFKKRLTYVPKYGTIITYSRIANQNAFSHKESRT
jgi:hypothetical protein